MIGDRDNIVGRFRDVMPPGWFDSDSPVLDTLLGALATPWSGLHQMVCYARNQTRIATATDGWLDLIALDFFGRRTKRRHQQSDQSFRNIISRELFRERATRRGLIRALEDITGRVPIVFEPGHAGDTGGYGFVRSDSAQGYYAFAYGLAGGWGNLDLPLQVFVTAFRPVREGGLSGAGWGGGGYSNGHSSYADIAMIQGTINDTDINEAILNALPICGVAWTRIMG